MLLSALLHATQLNTAITGQQKYSDLIIYINFIVGRSQA